MNLKKKLLFAGGLSALSLLATNVYSNEYAIIVNPNNTSSISNEDIKKIFLGKTKKFSNGDITIPLNAEGDSEIRLAFDEQILQRTSAQVSSYWSKLVFTGKGTKPKEIESDEEMIHTIEKNQGAIGYVKRSSVKSDSVKIVAEFEQGDK